jgi:FkbM family methyltransferase
MSLINTFSGQTIVGKILRYPLTLIPNGMTLRVLSGINKGSLWKAGASTHGCWLGTYEVDKQRVIGQFIKQTDVVLDIGANAGFYSLAFSRLIGPKGKVWAFEPFCDNLSNLRFHINMNKLENVSVIAAALSSESGLANFSFGLNNATGSISTQKIGKYLVPTFSLDDAIKFNFIDHPNFIKMDVEGEESKVLEGAGLILQKKNSIWLIALHGEDQRNRVLNIFKKYGYKVSMLNGSELSPAVFCDEIIAFP